MGNQAMGTFILHVRLCSPDYNILNWEEKTGLFKPFLSPIHNVMGRRVEYVNSMSSRVSTDGITQHDYVHT